MAVSVAVPGNGPEFKYYKYVRLLHPEVVFRFSFQAWVYCATGLREKKTAFGPFIIDCVRPIVRILKDTP
jgi:hypothetical protein